MSEGENMVERCARAASRAMAKLDYDAIPVSNKPYSEEAFIASEMRNKYDWMAGIAVGAVIEALMEPTAEMRDVAYRYGFSGQAIEFYQAMLRSILSQPDEGEGK